MIPKKLYYLLLSTFFMIPMTPSIGAEVEITNLSLNQKIELFEGDKILRPTKATAKLKPILKEYTVDGFKGNDLFLESSKLTLKTKSLPRWDTEKASSPKYSLSFKNRYTPQVKLSFSLLSKQLFPLKENPDSFIAYLAGLKSIHRDAISFDSTPINFRDTGYNRHLLNKPTYCIDYTIKGKKEEHDVTHHFDYLVSIDSYWIEISLVAPEEHFNHYIDPFKRGLRSTVIVQEND